MRVTTEVILDIETGRVIRRRSFQYRGSTAQCISGSGSKSKSKSTSQSSQESGTKFNEDFLNRAREFAAGQPSTSTERENFDSAAYLKAHPELVGDQLYGADPYQHWWDTTTKDAAYGPANFTAKAQPADPTYNPQYVRSSYTSGAYTPGTFTGANYTGIAPGGFDKLESSLYETQRSKLAQAYDQAVARQREELAQSGALNSPSQYLEGSARSSMDRSYIQNLQQAARDAFTSRLGLEETEAARKTGFDVGQAGAKTAFDVGEAGAKTAYDTGEAARRTAFDTGEAGRETGFNEQTAARILDLWLKKLGIAIEAGRYSTGQSTSSATGSSMGGSGGIFQFGGSSSS